MDLIVTNSSDNRANPERRSLAWCLAQPGWSELMLNVPAIKLLADLTMILSNRAIVGIGTQLSDFNVYLFGANIRIENLFHKGNVNSRFWIAAVIKCHIEGCTFMNGDDESLDIGSNSREVTVNNCQFPGPDHGTIISNTTADPSLLHVKFTKCTWRAFGRNPLIGRATVEINDCDIYPDRTGTEIYQGYANIINNRYHGMPVWDDRPIRVADLANQPLNSIYAEGNTWDQPFTDQQDLFCQVVTGAIPSNRFRTVPNQMILNS